MRFAIIGAGVIGGTHAAAVRSLGERAELALVVDRLPDRARKLAAEHGAEHADSAEAAFAREDIDAVAVCTPSGHHADLAVAALDAGKHVVVEKPLDVSLKAAFRVAEAERRSGRTVTVISQHRFDLASRLVRRAVEDGRFGRLTSAVASLAWWRSQGYYDSGDWRGSWALDGGGALMNQGVHTIDLLVWMLGDPVEVYAQTGCLAHERIEVEDTAVATVRFAGGALAVIHGTTAAYPGLTARLQIHGDRGSAVIDDDRLAYFHSADDAAGGESPAYGAGESANQAADLLAAHGGGAPAAPAGPRPRPASRARAPTPTSTATSRTP
ncbi:Gfo/Idh/MocA family protein [Phaeacidiphilus oryzae]|uniref:Gfo/Idh/MocA family protein n=1 Tax=Phaeacidiphilus oryzae TaxID=348818 RepID=UPI00068AE820|nr:Gfo/Idh/MocA family oxidoreductase [Phaeacidiphilus oryzae]